MTDRRMIVSHWLRNLDENSSGFGDIGFDENIVMVMMMLSHIIWCLAYNVEYIWKLITMVLDCVISPWKKNWLIAEQPIIGQNKNRIRINYFPILIVVNRSGPYPREQTFPKDRDKCRRPRICIKCFIENKYNRE